MTERHGSDGGGDDHDPSGLTSDGRATKESRPLTLLLSAIVVLLCLVSLFARPLGISGWPLVAQLISLKALLGLGFVVLALVMAGIAQLRGRLRSPLVLSLCAALLVTGAVHVGTVLARGGAADPVADAELTVMEFNTFDTATTAAQLAALVRSADADIVTLPEASEQTTSEAAALLAAGGLDFRVFTMTTAGPYPLPLSTLVRRSLGGYRQLPGPQLRYGSLLLEPDTAGSPRIIAVHPTNPGLRSSLSEWRSETTAAARQCVPGSTTIVAGDFNSTVDHPAFADLPCVDAATQAGAGSAGTWPSWMPSALAAPIDHVIVDPRAYRAVAAWTVRTGGSDHRALVVQLRRA